MMGGKSRDRERFPGLAEDIGEDPARYLDVDRIDDLELARARIRGVDFLATLRAWRAVERNLSERDVVSEHHRQRVMEWLDEREAELEEIGERDDRLSETIERREAGDGDVEPDDGPTVEHQACGSVAAPRDGPGHWCPDCECVTRDVAEAAADGGEER